MYERSFDEMIAYFNRRVSEMDIAQDCKAELLGMVVALGFKHEKSAQPERNTGKWIDDNCSVCGQYVYHGDARNYCPNCWAYMMEVDHET